MNSRGTGNSEHFVFYFCILHAKMLKEKKVDENIYKKVFSTPKSADNPLCRILVGVASIDEIKKAVVETSKACNFKEGEEGDLWRQLYTIYGVAIDKEYMKENPILGIIKEMDKQDSEIKYFKKHMTERYRG